MHMKRMLPGGFGRGGRVAIVASIGVPLWCRGRDRPRIDDAARPGRTVERRHAIRDRSTAVKIAKVEPLQLNLPSVKEMAQSPQEALIVRVVTDACASASHNGEDSVAVWKGGAVESVTI